MAGEPFFALCPVLSPSTRTVHLVAWDPWLEETSVDIYEAPLPVPGVYLPFDNAILIAKGQTESMRRSALAEELGHHVLGHLPHPNQAEVDRMEERAARWAAVRLVSIGDLMEALRSSDDVFDVAEELGVDPELLEVRIRWLSDDERRELGCDE